MCVCVKVYPWVSACASLCAVSCQCDWTSTKKRLTCIFQLETDNVLCKAPHNIIPNGFFALSSVFIEQLVCVLCRMFLKECQCIGTQTIASHRITFEIQDCLRRCFHIHTFFMFYALHPKKESRTKVLIELNIVLRIENVTKNGFFVIFFSFGVDNYCYMYWNAWHNRKQAEKSM